MQGLLRGARILDLGRATAGGFTTQLLGDLGAEVIKIESPENAEKVSSRSKVDEPKYHLGGEDVAFLSVNRNKKSMVLDLSKPEGLSVFYDLVKKGDVVFDNFRPGALEHFQIDYKKLKKINPKIICCSLTGYGSTGPDANRAAFDITIQASSGMMKQIGKRDEKGRIAYSNIAVGDLLGAMYSAYAIVSALFHQRQTGKGCLIDVGMQDAVISWFILWGLYPINFGIERDITKKLIWGSFKAKDRLIVICAHREAPWQNLCRALGRLEWLKDERFKTTAKRIENRDLLWSLIEEVLGTKDSEEWFEVFDKEGVPYSSLNSMSEALASPQTLHRNMVITVDHPDAGPIKLLGNPIKVEGFNEEFSHPPLLGEHTHEILSMLIKYPEEKIASLKKDGIVA
jgi:crotonobetainyl-CoA:carnitine CoA-transferase CaiB-like acyl-CoA transferase